MSQFNSSGRVSVLVVFLMMVLCLPARSQTDPGFFVNDWKGKVYKIQEGLHKPQTSKEAGAIVSVDVNDPINKASRYLFGGNLNPYSYLFKKNPGSVMDLKNMSPNVLRWPGGNLSNDYFWYAETNSDLPDDLPGTKYWLGSNPSTHDATTPDYYKTLEETNSVGCICVNYSYARYGKSEQSVQNAAHIAANWVRHDKGRTLFWEIGNENFGNWQSGYEIDPSLYTDGRPRFISGKIYGEHCKVFIDSMRVAAAEVGTEIFIGIQAWEDYTSWDPIQTAWNDGVFSQVGNLADFVVLHNYFTPYKDDSTIPTIFGTRSKVGHMVEVIDAMINKYNLDPMPIALTEYNLQSRASGQLTSYINGMHAVMVIGEGMKHGLGMAQRWSTVGYWSPPGEMGTFSFKGEPDVPEGNMRPEFYYYYFMQKNFGDVLVQSSSTNSKIVSYASTFSSGQCGIALLNTSNQEVTTQINISNFSKGDKYHQYILVGGDDNGDFSANVFVNGYGSEYIKGGPDKVYENIKPYTTEINGDHILVDIPAYGTVFLVVEGEDRPQYELAKVEADASIIELLLSEPVEEPVSSDGFRVKANGTEDLSIVSIQKSTVEPGTLLLTLGRDLLPTDKISISYEDGELTTSDSRDLVYFSDKEVINLLTGASPVIMEAQTVDGNFVKARFSKELEAENLTDIELYSQNAAPALLDLVSVKISPGTSTEVLFETVNTLSSIDKLFLKYANTSIASVDGGQLEAFSFDVENLLVPEVPQLDSAVLYENGKKLVLYYNQPMGGTNKETASFVVTSDDRIVEIQSQSTSGHKIVVYLKDLIGIGETVLLNYSGGSLASEKGTLANNIVDFEIVNNVVFVVVPEFFYDVKVQGVDSSYELDVLNDGKRVFTDREFAFVDVPDTLINAEFIRVPNNLKSATGSVLYSFKLNCTGKLFIAHDDRIAKPLWLSSGYTLTPYTLDIGGSISSLYFKNVEKDERIELGANQVPGTETGGCNNYVIIFDRASEGDTFTRSESFALGIKVFPVPARDQLNIVSEFSKMDAIRLIKLDGTVVKERKYDQLLKITLPVSDLANGIYILEITGGHQRRIEKIVISR
jgi:hypothetical protein